MERLFFYLWIFFGALFMALPALSAEVRFPEEELEFETTHPVFQNNPQVTMNRNVRIRHKLGLSLSVGYRSDEPFFEKSTFSGEINFFVTEIQGVSLKAFYFNPGLSSTGRQLEKIHGQTDKTQIRSLDMNMAPHPRTGVFLNYVAAPFYGKISFSKKITSHFNASAALGAGAAGLVQSTRRDPASYQEMHWIPALHLSLDKKLFIKNRAHIYLGLGFIGYYGPNQLSEALWNESSSVVDYDLFNKSILIRTIIQGGLGILLF